MKRTTFDDSRDQGPPAAQYDPMGALPCSFCDKPTKRETLANYGARCFSCYSAYCAEGLKGGAEGFATGRPDTDQQMQMRKRLKVGRPIGQAMARDETDAEYARRQQRAKVETQRKVDAATAVMAAAGLAAPSPPAPLSGTETRASAREGAH